MQYFSSPQQCTKCNGYITIPIPWSSTVPPIICNCPKEINLAWECPRCNKINAPWKGSCDCTPTPLISSPTCGTQPYTAGHNIFNHYFTKKDEE